MSEYKPLIYSLIIIFIIGLSINLIAPLVDLDVEEETTGGWIEPFVTITTSLINVLSYTISFITSFLEGIFGFITGFWEILTEEGVEIDIEIEGTGTHEGYTLDGTYIHQPFQPPITFYRGETSTERFRITGEEEIDTAVLRTSYWTFWWFSYDTIYELDYIDNFTIYLNKTNPDFDFNPTAIATILTEGVDIPEYTSITENIITFFDSVSEEVESKIRPIGLIPSYIGIPLMIILLLSLFWSIVKLIKS